jgi:6-pyruvoyl-tetrahydropterin synthase
MNRLKQLEIKKLMKELEYIEIDFSFKNEVISEVDSSFLKDVNDFLGSNKELKELYDKSINSKIDDFFNNKESDSTEIGDFKGIKIDDLESETIEQEVNFDIEEEVEPEIEVNEKSPKLRKLYREIVKVTHPDKVKNKKLNEKYIQATEFYDNDDLAGIYLICDEVGIEYEITEEDDILIKSKINILRQKIHFMESTFTWKWYYSKSQEERDNLILNFIKLQLR